MQRREFIKVLGGVAVALPVPAHAQQPKQMRRIGVILPANTENAEFQAFLASFLQGMALLVLDHRYSLGRSQCRRHS
jgi:hypothetical protein